MKTRKGMWALALLLVAMAVVLAAGGALADGAGVAEDSPVLWKMHCPAHYDVVQIPAKDWGGVHVLCIRAAR